MARHQPAAIAQAVELRRHVGELADQLLEGEHAALADQLAGQAPEHGGFPLPRATQEALAALAGGGRGEVRLPGGLVARAEGRVRAAPATRLPSADREET
jgi:hypothetical protein